MSRWGEEASGLQRALGSLMRHVGVALGVGAVVVVAVRLLGGVVEPVPAAAVAAVVGMLWWAVSTVAHWDDHERWTPATAVDPSLRVASDPRTRRLSGMITGADSRHRMSVGDLRQVMAAVVVDSLVRDHGADPDDPWPTARGLLAPQLVTFLADADAPPPALTRRLLHSWLTQIDHLTKRG